MVRPDPGSNLTRDKVWFAVLTWIQPKEEVLKGEQRIVCSFNGMIWSMLIARVLVVRALVAVYQVSHR